MELKHAVYKEPPEGFISSVEVSGCFCYCEDKLLILLRHPQKPAGNTWGIPGGKIEVSETPKMAVIREIHEEVGLNIEEALEKIGSIYCKLPHMGYIYHMFKKCFDSIPEVNLSLDEHIDYKWVTYEEALELPLIPAGAEALHFFKKGSF